MDTRERGTLFIALIIALAIHCGAAAFQLSTFPFSTASIPDSRKALEVSFVTTAEAKTPASEIPEALQPEREKPLVREEPEKLDQPREILEQKKPVEKPVPHELTLPVAEESAAPAVSVAPARDEDYNIEKSRNVIPAAPRYRENPPPEYPAAARRRGFEGLVILSVTVGTDGRARDVVLKSSSGHEILDRSALRAVRGWRFDPATRLGIPFVMTVDVPIRFELRDGQW